MTELEASATILQLIVNTLGEHPANFNMPKLMENFYKLNGKSWDVEKMETFLLIEIITAHRI